jgi:hypothetical protein
MAFETLAGPGHGPAPRRGGPAFGAGPEGQARLQPRENVSAMPISQAELERIDYLNRQQKRIQSEYDALRLSIIERHRGDVPVESGRLLLSVKEELVHQLTNAELERILGTAEVERLRAQVRPQIRTKVSVKSR